MEPGSAVRESGVAPSAWPPPWLQAHLVPDSRFERAYNALGDRRRALLKRVIAGQFALHPPRPVLRSRRRDFLPGGLTLGSTTSPRPFVVLLVSAGVEAPALLLAALLPVLAQRPGDVLVAWLGRPADLPDTLLAACELAGQERVAAVGPRQAARLFVSSAACGRPGLALYAECPAVRRILAVPQVRAVLEISPLSLCGLRPPHRAGLWRDAPEQFDPDDVALLYGSLPFARPAAGETLAVFSASRDLLLLPDAHAGEGRAACSVCESRLGMFAWPQLCRGLLTCRAVTYSSAPPGGRAAEEQP